MTASGFSSSDPARLASARAVLERISDVVVMRAEGDLLDFSLPDASTALPGCSPRWRVPA